MTTRPERAERERLELETVCRVCRRRWIPLHADYIRNTWRVCPRCRPTEPDRPAPQPTTGGNAP